jgi:hypothetical protein
MSITAHYPGFQITCYAAYSPLRPRFLTNCITERNPHKGDNSLGLAGSPRPRCGGLQSPNRTVTPTGTTLPGKTCSFMEGFKPRHHVRE